MGTLSNEEIVEAAETLRPRLGEMLGKSGASQAESLLTSLDTSNEEAVRRTANRLLDIFQEHAALEEMKDTVSMLAPHAESSGSAMRGYSPLGGEPGPIAAAGVLYRCPVSGCDFTWQPQVAGQSVPLCPHHHRCLVKEGEC
jgi:hypothetical protein